MDDILRRLVIRSFHIEKVSFSEKTAIIGKELFISKDIINIPSVDNDLIVEITLDIIKPHQLNIETNTIMDVIPISTKVLGKLGDGVTHTLTGVCVLLTGCDEDGRQMHEFGSSEGILCDNIVLDKNGTPASEDYILHVNILLKGSQPFSRELCNPAFQATDEIIQQIRDILKQKSKQEATEDHEFFDKINRNGKKVVLVKQIAGQGAMYDNMLHPDEPSGFAGGHSIINLSNMPIILSPNEYRDGAIRAMT